MVSRNIWIPLCIFLTISHVVFGDDIAHIRRDEAYALHRAGRQSEALSVLEPVLGSVSDSSDIFYLHARILASAGNLPYSWIPPLEKAHRIATWERFTPADAISRLTNGYMVTRRYADALALLDSYPELVLSDPTYATHYANALSRIGAASQADEFLAKATAIYPNSVSLQLLRIRSSTSYKSSIAERIVNAGLFADEYEILREIVLSPTVIADDIRRKCLDLMGSHHIDDLSVTIEALALADEIDDSAVSQILQNFPRQQSQISRLLEILRETTWESDINDIYADFSGAIEDDLNGDAIFEMSTHYTEGEIDSVMIDQNQDGINDFSSKFREGTPVSAVIALDEGHYHLTFSPYPYVSFVGIVAIDKVTEYTVGAGTFIYPFTSTSDASMFPQVIIRLPEMPSEEELSERSTRVTVESELQGMKMRRVERLSAGRRTVLEEYRDGKLYRKTTLSDGSTVHALSDTDFDGTFDMREIISHGAVSEIHFDEDGDGNAEYRHLMAKNIEEWDFNDDGVIDCRELYSEDEVTRLYSSNLDGVFDITISIGDDFVRNGQPMKLYQDSFGNYWIGTPPREELLSNIPWTGYEHSGLDTLMIFTVQGRRYIEVVH